MERTLKTENYIANLVTDGHIDNPMAIRATIILQEFVENLPTDVSPSPLAIHHEGKIEIFHENLKTDKLWSNEYSDSEVKELAKLVSKLQDS